MPAAHKMGPCKDRHATMLYKPEREKEFKQRAALASLVSLSKLSKLQKKPQNSSSGWKITFGFAWV